jgi:hypothetical protein
MTALVAPLEFMYLITNIGSFILLVQCEWHIDSPEYSMRFKASGDHIHIEIKLVLLLQVEFGFSDEFVYGQRKMR